MLTKVDLKAISSIVSESIQTQAPPLVEKAIQTQVPPLIKKETYPIKRLLMQLAKRTDKIEGVLHLTPT